MYQKSNLTYHWFSRQLVFRNVPKQGFSILLFLSLSNCFQNCTKTKNEQAICFLDNQKCRLTIPLVTLGIYTFFLSLVTLIMLVRVSKQLHSKMHTISHQAYNWCLYISAFNNAIKRTLDRPLLPLQLHSEMRKTQTKNTTGSLGRPILNGHIQNTIYVLGYQLVSLGNCVLEHTISGFRCLLSEITKAPI